MDIQSQNHSFYFLKRTLAAIPLLLGVATIVFLISRLAPGDPVSAMVSPTMSASSAEALRHQYELDQPVPTQFMGWIKNVASGDLGVSLTHHQPVLQVIGHVLPNTLILASAALLIEILIGSFLGYLAAARPGMLLDTLISRGAIIVYSLPAFWIGVVLLTIFSYTTGLLPSSHMVSLETSSMTLIGRFVDVSRHLALPALTVALTGVAGVSRYFRASLIEVKTRDYVAFAESLGLSRRSVFFRYEFPNAVTPVVVFLGLEFGTLLAGTVVTETLFAWPGMGRLAIMAILARDYPLVMGCTLISGAIVIACNLMADVVQSLIDPRVRLAR